MRTRLIVLLVPIVALSAFVALNWSQFVQPSQISWGWGSGDAPLGLILLAVLALSWIGFLVGTAYLETRYKLDAHRNAKALEAQRLLADKAEASRFFELRAYLESQATLAVQRENATVTHLEQAVRRDQREMLDAVERLNAKLTVYTGGLAERVVVRQDGHTPH